MSNTHTQETVPVVGAGLTNGMTWVDGYGYHYQVVDIRPETSVRIVDGYLSNETDPLRSVIRLRPVGEIAPDLTVSISIGDVFNVLPF